MLGGQGPLDRALVKEWMTFDWQASYGTAYNTSVLTGLAGHLDALLAQPLPAVALDDPLIAQARTAFSRVPLAARVYSRIKPSAAAQALPPWRPSDALGRAGLQRFCQGIRQESERRHTGFPDRRWLPQGAAAGLAGGNARSGWRKAG